MATEGSRAPFSSRFGLLADSALKVQRLVVKLAFPQKYKHSRKISMLYPLKVNMALAKMQVAPKIFDPVWRSGMQQIGKNANCSPEETAIAIIGHGLGIGYPDEAIPVINRWIASGKVNKNRPEIFEALSKMGLGALVGNDI
jgi:hypothetical protein